MNDRYLMMESEEEAKSKTPEWIWQIILISGVALAFFVWSSSDDKAPAKAQWDRFEFYSNEDRAAVERVIAACPGLRRYPADWMVDEVVERAGLTNVHIVIANPLQDMPYAYYATGHHCQFQLGGDRPDRVAVVKRPCVSACLDESAQSETSTWFDIQ
ncbi:hypothetical protein [Pseudoxanthomonas sp. UTMC 1351]|uniref:hypothetical protein n=1 Tax=Pseudoxanthomonas sp. UTMC 1351 TaxID=2695853 RepID=UPI0034CD981A